MKLRDTFSDDIQNIIFDMGNVLIDLDIPATVRAFAALNVGGLRPEDIHPLTIGLFLEYELGNIDDSGFIAAIRETYDCSGVTDAELFAAWNAMLSDVDLRRFALLEKLKENYRLFVLSNTNEGHIRHVKELFREASGGREFESFFERCFYSHDMHLRKPDPEIYRQVIRETGVDPEKTLFIDDNACNISPAAALKLKTHCLAVGKETIRDLFH